MRLSQRELVLGWVTAVVLVSAVLFVALKPQIEKWRRTREAQRVISDEILRDQRLVKKAPVWQKKLEDLQKDLPQHPKNKDVTADVLIKLDKLAKRHDVRLLRRDPSPEKTHEGLFYELPVTCSWEATDSAIVHFLFDLQTKSGMMDIKQLRIQPKGGGILKGSFIVSSAYSKGDN